MNIKYIKIKQTKKQKQKLDTHQSLVMKNLVNSRYLSSSFYNKSKDITLNLYPIKFNSWSIKNHDNYSTYSPVDGIANIHLSIEYR